MTTSKVDEEDIITTYVKVCEDDATPDPSTSAVSDDNREQWTDDRPSPLYMTKRVVIGAVGLLLGILTFVPNAMTASMSAAAAHVGLVASFLFIAGGLMGSRTSRAIWLLPAVLLQGSLFLYLFFQSGE